MSKGVAITGMGIISSIGNSVEENLNALLKSKHGISKISNITTRHKDEIKVGEIKLTNDELLEQLNLPESNNYSRTAMLGVIAAKEAIKNANISDINDCRTGLISATSVGGMDMTEKYYYEYLEDETHRKYIEGHNGGDATQKIAEQLGITEFATTISTACSSSANAIMLGARMIKAGKLDSVVVGGADCLSKFTINGFKTLMILSDTYCKPFDKDRTGLNLGEAAAFLVLESDDIVAKQNKKKINSSRDPVLAISLRELRDEIHKKEKIPHFQIFTQQTLYKICDELPTTAQDLLKVEGMGKVRVEKYGGRILDVISFYCKEQGIKKIKDKDTTKQVTLKLFKEGFTISEIAKKRDLKLTTIESHLVSFIGSGDVDVREIIPLKRYQKIVKEIEEVSFKNLTELKEKVDTNFTFMELRMVLLSLEM
mgnify:CR=1 FL=1